jgi:pimeloyl-ACP methyl ester carboxylesterase
MKQVRLVACVGLALGIMAISGCTDTVTPIPLREEQVDLTTHKIEVYSSLKNSKYLMVFESGLGDGAQVWKEGNLLESVMDYSDLLLYDRAGYEQSTKGPDPRDVNMLRTDLEKVIAKKADGRKLILVAHSLGAMILRDFAIKNSSKIAAILFLDPSHESYNNPTQEVEDFIFGQFKAVFGPDFGGTMEARQLVEDASYMRNLPPLPDVPTMVVTSMKEDAQHSKEDRSEWYAAHEKLGVGLTDFKHFTTTKSGHYIQKEEPVLVEEKIKALLSKLP